MKTTIIFPSFLLVFLQQLARVMSAIADVVVVVVACLADVLLDGPEFS